MESQCQCDSLGKVDRRAPTRIARIVTPTSYRDSINQHLTRLSFTIMSTRRRIGVSAATTEAARRQLMQPVPCFEKMWVTLENAPPGSTLRVYKWVKTEKTQVSSLFHVPNESSDHANIFYSNSATTKAKTNLLLRCPMSPRLLKETMKWRMNHLPLRVLNTHPKTNPK